MKPEYKCQPCKGTGLDTESNQERFTVYCSYCKGTGKEDRSEDCFMEIDAQEARKERQSVIDNFEGRE